MATIARRKEREVTIVMTEVQENRSTHLSQSSRHVEAFAGRCGGDTGNSVRSCTSCFRQGRLGEFVDEAAAGRGLNTALAVEVSPPVPSIHALALAGRSFSSARSSGARASKRFGTFTRLSPRACAARSRQPGTSGRVARVFIIWLEVGVAYCPW